MKNWKTIFSEYMKYSEKFIWAAIWAVYKTPDLQWYMRSSASNIFVYGDRDEESIFEFVQSAYKNLKSVDCSALKCGELRTAHNIIFIRTMLKRALHEKDVKKFKFWIGCAGEELSAKRSSILGSI